MATDFPVSKDVFDGAVLVAEAFQRAGVPYALIGGLAVAFRIGDRFTRDVDCLLEPTQLKLPALLDDLAAHGITFEPATTIREWTRQHMTTLAFRGVQIDWLKPVIPLYQHILERATDEVWLSHPIRVASVEGLILLKLLAWRAQDQHDIETLVAGHRGNLDLAWIEAEWATVAEADDPRVVRLRELAGRPVAPPT